MNRGEDMAAFVSRMSLCVCVHEIERKRGGGEREMGSVREEWGETRGEQWRQTYGGGEIGVPFQWNEIPILNAMFIHVKFGYLQTLAWVHGKVATGEDCNGKMRKKRAKEKKGT